MTAMGIVSTGTWFPETYVTAEEIAAQSGMPEWVVREKLGIERKFVADPEVHPNDMAVKAARKAIDKAGIDPMEIDVVLCTTEEWREYLLWTTAIDLAYRIGAKKAWGLDIHTRCATTIAALKMARSLMADDPAINTILIGGGYAVSHFIDLTDVNTSFLFNIGAGAGAMIVKRDWPENRVLGDHLIADGVMSRHVIVPASGTVQHPTDAAVAGGGFKFRLVEPEAMKAASRRSFHQELARVRGCLARKVRRQERRHAIHPRRHRFLQHVAGQAFRSSRNARAPGAELRSKAFTCPTSATSASRTPSSISNGALNRAA